jgi:ABC-type Fe3+/spermidine/putrescine transport system ATPase subunit
VFQSYAIWPHMTVFENVAYPLRVRHRAAADIRDLVTRTLRLIEMDGFAVSDNVTVTAPQSAARAVVDQGPAP